MSRVDQRVAQVEILGHADERVVHRRIAVRVKVLENLTDNAGTLAVARVAAHSELGHRIKNAALDRLEAVPRIRQSALHDDAHRVIEVAAPHLSFNAGELNCAEILVQCRGFLAC